MNALKWILLKTADALLRLEDWLRWTIGYESDAKQSVMHASVDPLTKIKILAAAISEAHPDLRGQENAGSVLGAYERDLMTLLSRSTDGTSK